MWMSCSLAPDAVTIAPNNDDIQRIYCLFWIFSRGKWANRQKWVCVECCVATIRSNRWSNTKKWQQKWQRRFRKVPIHTANVAIISIDRIKVKTKQDKEKACSDLPVEIVQKRHKSRAIRRHLDSERVTVWLRCCYYYFCYWYWCYGCYRCLENAPRFLHASLSVPLIIVLLLFCGVGSFPRYECDSWSGKMEHFGLGHLLCPRKLTIQLKFGSH